MAQRFRERRLNRAVRARRQIIRVMIALFGLTFFLLLAFFFVIFS